jgi:hypothetical protein
MANRDARIWRFMDFTKYVAMLDAGGVYFTRADQFADPFEGTVARPNLPRRHRLARSRVFVNCWHRNDHESAAMWRIYLKSDEGVAIESTAERLAAAPAAARPRVTVAPVAYLDYARERMREGDELAPFLHKRKSFEYEQEVRALFVDDDPEDAGGRYVKVDLGALLERVVISPQAESWLRPLVESVSRKYGLEIPVEESELAVEPYDAG